MSVTLHSSLRIGRYELAHRVVMAPLTRMRASEPGSAPTSLNARYYGQRASPDGLIIAEATQISWQGKGYPRTPGIHTDEQVAGWKGVVDAVHDKGGLIFLQLWHTGRISHSSHRPDRGLPVSASAITPAGQAFGSAFERLPYETPRALDTEEIPEVVEDYKRAAARAIFAGFDGVELHGANGYLIDQFLQDRTNNRTDQYGGSIANRVRFLLEVTDGLINVCGNERVGVRLSPFGTVGDIGDSDPLRLFAHAIEALSARRIAYLHLIEPRANAGVRDEANLDAPASVAALFRRAFKGPLIASGGFTKLSAEAELKSGTVDAIAFGRAFIANPDLPHRLAIDAPLNAFDRRTFYGGDERGYTDYPALASLRGVA
ncbi:alkene reductase [Bradyrhizobium sp. BRP22]|uniref:alkene reductase n=1 Tax=Bradyrhizobium sp. BRP22 TaxID=2793821 RepID=UPI001CD59BFC|nr:alkene reductase [Bradyrhizobium sp. BRP22]MCA1452192.1 alkene reductase [Bradyrhizobium sp. BRP22]